MKNHLTENLFAVDSLSALEDYIRLSPALVKRIECHDPKKQPLLSAWKYVCECLTLEVEEPSTSGIRGFVQITALHASDLFAQLKSQPRQKHLMIALDQITDPRNFGAIVRTASYFGVSHIIVPERRQVGITPSAVDTAQAGFATTKIVQVTNLTRTLNDLKKLSYWIIGTALDGQNLNQYKSFDKAVLVLGAEDKGLSRLVAENCDQLFKIQGVEQGAQSLNVSVAAGIMVAAMQA